MPDITVQFELGNEGAMADSAISRINAAIDSIVGGINDKPLYLKFDIHPDSVSSIKTSLQEIANEFSTSMGLSGLDQTLRSASAAARKSGSSGGATKDSTLSQAKEEAAAAKETAAARNEQAQATERAAEAAQKAAKVTEKASKEEIQAQKAAKKAQEDAAKAAAKQAEYARKNNTATNVAEQSRLLGKINSKYSSVSRAIEDWTAAKVSGSSEIAGAYHSLEGLRTKYADLFRRVSSGVTTDIPTIKEELTKLNIEWDNNSNIIKVNNKAHKSLGDTVTDTIKKFSSYFSVSRLLMGAVRVSKQMVKETIAVNDAMTQLQIVTHASNKDMEEYGKTSYQTAKDLGASVTDVLSSTTTFARLGYNLSDSGMLAKYTTMLQNVGDIDAASAQSAITAIIKAFDIQDISQVEGVMDKLVAVGNGAPISVAEIAEGLNNVASASAAANNSLDETIALLTAANTTTQNISKSSTGLRTIMARIMNQKTELDDLGESMTQAEYQNIVRSLTNNGVSLIDEQTGKMKNTFQIFSEIASVAEQLKKTDINAYYALAETLAGNRQQNIFFSLVDNFNEATAAMGLMENSTGSLQKAYDTFLSSTSAHLQQFKTAFSELSTDLIDTGVMNAVIDFGSVLVGIADKSVNISKAFGSIGPVLAGFAGFKVGNGIKSFV